jgi:hypothetical protein
MARMKVIALMRERDRPASTTSGLFVNAASRARSRNVNVRRTAGDRERMSRAAQQPTAPRAYTRSPGGAIRASVASGCHWTRPAAG